MTRLLMPGCHTTELLLSCPPGEMVIIHSASFTSSRAKLNCSQVTRHSQRVDSVSRAVREGDSDIRRFVTRRCSGYSSGEECKFSLLLDVVESEVWGGGLVTIIHTCLTTRNIRQDCQHDINQVRRGSSGAISPVNGINGRGEGGREGGREDKNR